MEYEEENNNMNQIFNQVKAVAKITYEYYCQIMYQLLGAIQYKVIYFLVKLSYRRTLFITIRYG